MPDDLPEGFQLEAAPGLPEGFAVEQPQVTGSGVTMRGRILPPMPSPLTATGPGPLGIPPVPRMVQQAGSGFVRGLTSTLGGPGDLYDALDRYVAGTTVPAYRDAARLAGNWVRRQLGAQEIMMPPRVNEEEAAASGPIVSPVQPPTLTPPGVPQHLMRPLGLPSSAELQAPLRNAGVIDNPELAPRTPGERFVTRAAETAGAFPAGPRAIVSGITGGLASQAAEELGRGPWAQLGAGIAGGLGGHAIYGVGARLVNSAAGNLTPLGQAFRDARMRPRMVGDVSGNPVAQRLQLAGAAMPGGAGMATRAAAATANDFTTAIDRAANQYGNARTAEQAGEALQTGARNWVQNWRAGSERAWNDVLAVLPADTTIPVTNLRTVVNAVGQRMRDVPDVAGVLNSDRFTALRTAINQSPAEWRSESVRTMRTIIGQLNEARGVVGNLFTGELDQMYGALSDDIRAAVAMRPGGLRAWETANAITRTGHQIVDEIVTPLIREGVTPSTAYQFAISQMNARTGGGARIGRIADITGAGGDVASTLISQAGQRVAEGGGLPSFAQLTDPRSARGLAPEAATALFGTPGSYDRRLMEALDMIARNARATQQFANTSRTAPTSALIQTLASALPAAGAVGGALSGTVPLSIAGPTIATALGTPLAGYLTALATTNRPMAAYLAARAAQPAFGRGVANQLIQSDLDRRRGTAQ